MNLVDLQNVSRSVVEVSNNLGQLAGALLAYHNPCHFKVLNADFERVSQENHANNTWSCPGSRPHITHRFAQYGKGKDQITLSTVFDCTE